MALDFAQNRDLFPIDGRVLTSGGSLDVTNGVLAIVDNKSVSSRGRKVLNAFAGLPKDKDFQILLGAMDKPVTRSTTNKPYESLPFKLDEVVDLKVVAPKTKGIKVDDFIIGFNGTNGTELTLKNNSASRIEVTLCGDPMLHLGYKTGEVTLTLNLQTPYTDEDGNPVGEDAVTMQEIVENAVAEFNRMTLLGGAPVTDYVEAIPVNSLNEALEATTDFTFYTLTIADRGDQTALARVQAQYPAYKVVRTDYNGDDQSVYTLLAPEGTSLTAYTTSLAQVLKGCEDCPAGYSELTDGVVYSITIEDDGADLSTTVDDLPGYISGTRAKIGTSVNGVGTYTIVTDNAVTDAEIATFKAAAAVNSTAVITELGNVLTLCENTTTTTTAWVEGETCSAISKTFSITIPDDGCGNTRLAELQAQYPDLTITMPTRNSVNSTRTVTLTGSSGTANISVGGTNYLATYASSLTQTATNFVSAHAATILADEGVTVTSSGTVLTFTGLTATIGAITITNATTNLAGTLGTATVVPETVTEMCQTKYETTVITNIVCEECSEEFRALFTATPPANFEVYSWTTTATTFDEDAKMGIRFRGKEFKIVGGEQFRDNMPFYYTSTRLKVAGGQPTFIAESWNSQDRPYKVTVLSIASDPEALGAHLWEREDASRVYFDGVARFEGNNYANWLWGKESVLKPLAQYVDYQLTIFPKKYYQYTPHSSEMITYHIFVELGRHEDVENLLNKLAQAAGLPIVQAFSK